MSNEKMKVISNDGQEFAIDYDIAKQSKLLKTWFDDSLEDAIRLAIVEASTLKLIINFCDHHKNDPEAQSSDDDDDDDDTDTKKNIQELKQNTVSDWDRKFVQQFSVQDGSLFDIIIAANYLGINILLKTLCKSVIYMIRGKSSQEIREIFKLVQLIDESTNNNNNTTSPVDNKSK